MRFLSGFSGRRCGRVQDEIFSLAVDPEATPLAPESLRHLDKCTDCQDFSKAWPVVNRLGMTWRATEPPAGLALKTIENLKPLWRDKEKPIHRHEIRLLWSSGLAMAGSLVATFLIVVDHVSPIGQSVEVEALFRLGIKVAVLQLLGAGLVSVVVLAVRAGRSTKREFRDRDSGSRGGD